MRGLKTQESAKFCRFHELVESEAEKNGCIFFGFCGEGRDFETPDMEGEDLSGWLIPKEKADKFENLWVHARAGGLDGWADYFVFVIWRMDGDRVNVEFKSF